jgi:hypothetical protein
MITSSYDSLISIPQEPYPLTPEDSLIIDTLPCVDDTLHFNGIEGDTIDGMLAYFWDFGNGQVSKNRKADVYYSAPGSYNVKLILTLQNAYVDTVRFVLVKLDCSTKMANPSDTSETTAGSFTVFLYPGNQSVNNASTVELKSSDGKYKVVVFPNPTTGIFSISCTKRNAVFFTEITNIFGNTVLYEESTNNFKQFDLSSQAKGIYFIKVNISGEKTYSGKIIYQ